MNEAYHEYEILIDQYKASEASDSKRFKQKEETAKLQMEQLNSKFNEFKKQNEKLVKERNDLEHKLEIMEEKALKEGEEREKEFVEKVTEVKPQNLGYIN